MLPCFCRVTGNSRNLPKPNYFPLLPAISLVEARKLLGKQHEHHLYVPVIEFASKSQALLQQCHITSHADGSHSFQQLPPAPGADDSGKAGKCRITAKHTVNRDYKYVFPVLNDANYDAAQLKKMLKQRKSSLPGGRHRYVYQVEQMNLVLPPEMEQAVRSGDIENLLLSKDGANALVRVKNGPNLNLNLRTMEPPTDGSLLQGAGQDDDVLDKQKQVRKYRKRKVSDPRLQLRAITPEYKEEEVIKADWATRMAELTAGHRSASNLLVVGTDWRDLVYPQIDAWDWESFPSLSDIPPEIPLCNVTPVQLPPPESPVRLTLNEEVTGFETVPVYDESIPVTGARHHPSQEFIRALDKVQQEQAETKLRQLFSDAESLMVLPFVHEVAAVVEAMARAEAGWMCSAEDTGLKFVKELPENCTAQVPGQMVPLSADEQRFVVGMDVPGYGFMPGRCVDGRFRPGFVVQNAEGAGFIPGYLRDKVFTAGEMIEGRFVPGQAVQTLFGPKFLPGCTVKSEEGLKFVAGRVVEGKFHSGQVFQTESGPTWVSGVTYDTPAGARFTAGQVDDAGHFVAGQVVDGQFIPGQTIETPTEGPLFIPGRSYTDQKGEVKFCPGRELVMEDGRRRFVPGETILTQEGRQFVAGLVQDSKFVPCKIDEDGGVGPATQEEDVFVQQSLLGDGLPIDNNTFTAVPRKKPDVGYMVQHQEKVKFLPTEQAPQQLLASNDDEPIKIVPGQLMELDDSGAKFVPGKSIETALGRIFIPGQAVKTGDKELFVPGQVIDTGDRTPMFCPGQMVQCGGELGKRFIPGQVFSGKNGPRFIPGKILTSPSGNSTFIPGQVFFTDEGSRFLPGNIVDHPVAGPCFVPGTVLELPNGGIKFIAGEVIETEDGPRYVLPEDTASLEQDQELLVQGFPVSPEELRLITAYPFAALHYPNSGEGSVINSRMLRQMAAAGITVNRLTNTSAANANDVTITAEQVDESILGADFFRTTEPELKPAKQVKNKKGKGKADANAASANNNLPNASSVDGQGERGNAKSGGGSASIDGQAESGSAKSAGGSSSVDGQVGNGNAKSAGGASSVEGEAKSGNTKSGGGSSSIDGQAESGSAKSGGGSPSVDGQSEAENGIAKSAGGSSSADGQKGTDGAQSGGGSSSIDGQGDNGSAKSTADKVNAQSFSANNGLNANAIDNSLQSSESSLQNGLTVGSQSKSAGQMDGHSLTNDQADGLEAQAGKGQTQVGQSGNFAGSADANANDPSGTSVNYVGSGTENGNGKSHQNSTSLTGQGMNGTESSSRDPLAASLINATNSRLLDSQTNSSSLGLAAKTNAEQLTNLDSCGMLDNDNDAAKSAGHPSGSGELLGDKANSSSSPVQQGASNANHQQPAQHDHVGTGIESSTTSASEEEASRRRDANTPQGPNSGIGNESSAPANSNTFAKEQREGQLEQGQSSRNGQEGSSSGQTLHSQVTGSSGAVKTSSALSGSLGDDGSRRMLAEKNSNDGRSPATSAAGALLTNGQNGECFNPGVDPIDGSTHSLSGQHRGGVQKGGEGALESQGLTERQRGTIAGHKAGDANEDLLLSKDGPEPRSEDAAGTEGTGAYHQDRSKRSPVSDFFARIKLDMDALENDPYVRESLQEAEAWALANGRPDLADKVRQLMDLLKDTTQDPDVKKMELMQQIITLKRLTSGNSDDTGADGTKQDQITAKIFMGMEGGWLNGGKDSEKDQNSNQGMAPGSFSTASGTSSTAGGKDAEKNRNSGQGSGQRSLSGESGSSSNAGGQNGEKNLGQGIAPGSLSTESGSSSTTGNLSSPNGTGKTEGKADANLSGSNTEGASGTASKGSKTGGAKSDGSSLSQKSPDKGSKDGDDSQSNMGSSAKEGSKSTQGTTADGQQTAKGKSKGMPGDAVELGGQPNSTATSQSQNGIGKGVGSSSQAGENTTGSANSLQSSNKANGAQSSDGRNGDPTGSHQTSLDGSSTSGLHGTSSDPLGGKGLGNQNSLESSAGSKATGGQNGTAVSSKTEDGSKAQKGQQNQSQNQGEGLNQGAGSSSQSGKNEASLNNDPKSKGKSKEGSSSQKPNESGSGSGGGSQNQSGGVAGSNRNAGSSAIPSDATQTSNGSDPKTKNGAGGSSSATQQERLADGSIRKDGSGVNQSGAYPTNPAGGNAGDGSFVDGYYGYGALTNQSGVDSRNSTAGQQAKNGGSTGQGGNDPTGTKVAGSNPPHDNQSGAVPGSGSGDGDASRSQLTGKKSQKGKGDTPGKGKDSSKGDQSDGLSKHEEKSDGSSSQSANKSSGAQNGKESKSGINQSADGKSPTSSKGSLEGAGGQSDGSPTQQGSGKHQRGTKSKGSSSQKGSSSDEGSSTEVQSQQPTVVNNRSGTAREGFRTSEKPEGSQSNQNESSSTDSYGLAGTKPPGFSPGDESQLRKDQQSKGGDGLDQGQTDEATGLKASRKLHHGQDQETINTDDQQGMSGSNQKGSNRRHRRLNGQDPFAALDEMNSGSANQMKSNGQTDDPTDDLQGDGSSGRRRRLLNGGDDSSDMPEGSSTDDTMMADTLGDLNPSDDILQRKLSGIDNNNRRRSRGNSNNPRRVSSRSSSFLYMDLSEEEDLDLSDLGDRPDGPIPQIITSAKDISREVIDTLRYSRDAAMKELYTRQILEALNPGGSRKGSACIILKDFLQTIVPQEAAHSVLIGDIDYMVVDDEGVRYFESASGFASRRNSRFDIKQAVRSRSGSRDNSADLIGGPLPWADVGPRGSNSNRRMSIDEFRKKLQEQDSSVEPRPKERHGRHSVASLPVSRSNSGFIPAMPSSASSRRASLADSDLAIQAAHAILGRKRHRVPSVDVTARRLSRTSYD